MLRIQNLILFLLLSASMSCSNKKSPPVNQAPRSTPLCQQGPAPPSYCDTIKTYTGNVTTVSGTATYKPREIINGILSGEVTTPLPIRYAEIEVTDSNGNVAQCGETDANGNFSLQLPMDSQTYTISIRSRANNNHYKAQVFDAPERKNLYSLSTQVTTTTSNITGITLTASATGNILSGAFNILDQVLKANDFLRTQVGACPFSGCQQFTVAPNIDIYWEKGFNPATYFDPNPSSPASFYLMGYSCLFISGGNGTSPSTGDPNNEDTDHFDNSIILHEYGHFLEDVYSKSDSPGGSHGGNRIIDPRLAWGEGWGNFFQAAVRNSPDYIDTFGNTDGTNYGYIFNIPLEDVSTFGCSSSPSKPGCDLPTNNGEGNFREFAITRTLWDLFDDATETGDNVNASFPDIWATLTSSTGFLDPLTAFRSIGLLHERQPALTGSTPDDWSSVQTLHKQNINRTQFAQYVTGGSCVNYTLNSKGYSFFIDGIDDPNDTGSIDTANLLMNADFYHYKHSGGGLTIELSYQTDPSDPDETPSEPDMDLYLIRETDALSSPFKVSENYIDGNINTSETESISISNLDPGNYLIVVIIYTGVNDSGGTIGNTPNGLRFPAGSQTYYNILANGVTLCPSSL
ncbi:MAG: hypothetical protein D6797_07945 [Bdellovibrio sp.]|nr:MAG: hypothetical protein D6797_07945 [Bdellovibrio sp.]